MERCEKAVSDDMDRRDLFAHHMRLLIARGRHQDVVRWSRKVLDTDFARTDARFYLAVGLRKSGSCREAVAHYREYARQRPDDADPHFGLGLCYEALGDPKRAAQAYAKYLTLEWRGTRKLWRQQAEMRVANLKQQGAANVAAQAIPAVAPASVAKAPPRPVPRVANCDGYKRAVATDPFDTNAYEKLASCLVDRKDHATVVRFMRVALRDNPEYARGWLHLGLAQRGMGRTSESKSSLKKACRGGVMQACALE